MAEKPSGKTLKCLLQLESRLYAEGTGLIQYMIPDPVNGSWTEAVLHEKQDDQLINMFTDTRTA